MNQTKLMFLLLLPTFACAGAKLDAQKIATVSTLYMQLESDGDDASVYALASPTLKAAFDRDEHMADGEMACLDYDVVVQGQDFDAQEIKRTLKLTLLPSGQVNVRFNNFNQPQSVNYQLLCTDGVCLIDDIIQTDGSFKTNLNKCLDAM